MCFIIKGKGQIGVWWVSGTQHSVSSQPRPESALIGPESSPISGALQRGIQLSSLALQPYPTQPSLA